MPIQKKRILQLGDLHFQKALDSQPHYDDKDPEFSDQVKNLISRRPMKVVLKHAYTHIKDATVDATVFVGDLSDKGSIQHYNAAVQYVMDALQVGKDRLFPKHPFGVVPGNHDINRELAKNPDIFQKFHPLNEALGFNGAPTFSPEHPTQLDVPGAENMLTVQLMNTCWGCGVKANIPSQFRTEIIAAIEKSIDSKGESAIEQYYSGQLDTPAIAQETIDGIAQLLRDTKANILPVLVGHHNLLPQYLTRIAPYTELVNSGALRVLITESSRPAIYLHGHIHTDPIETVSTPNGNVFLSISAPLLEDGFNIVEISFTETHLPLSCSVEKWRFNEGGIFQLREIAKVPLVSRKRRVRSPHVGLILNYIISGKQVFWGDLVKHVEAKASDLTPDGLAEEIDTLEAEQLIEIENKDMSDANWIVRSNL